MARSAGRTRPVIKDVAKLAGVSAPTVSRYLNGTVNVTEDKRERIAKANQGAGLRAEHCGARSVEPGDGLRGGVRGQSFRLLHVRNEPWGGGRRP